MRILILVVGAGLLSVVPATAQDAVAGEKVFAQCRACHQIGESAKNAVGPVLNGLFGRKAGSIEGFNYSAANKNSGLTWDEATFREYIKDPKAKIPGTKMIFPGLKDPKQIDDVVAYLKQFDSKSLRPKKPIRDTNILLLLVSFLTSFLAFFISRVDFLKCFVGKGKVHLMLSKDAMASAYSHGNTLAWLILY